MARKEILYRSGLGRELTFDELDQNFLLAEQGEAAIAYNNTTLVTTTEKGNIQGSIELTHDILAVDASNIEDMYYFTFTGVTASGFYTYSGHFFYDKPNQADPNSAGQWYLHDTTNLRSSAATEVRLHAGFTVEFDQPGNGVTSTSIYMKLKDASVNVEYRVDIFKGIKTYFGA